MATVGPSKSCDAQAEHDTVASHGHPTPIRGDESTSGYAWLVVDGFCVLGDPIAEIGQIGAELVDRESKAEDALDVIDVQTAPGARLAQSVHGATTGHRGLIEGSRGGCAERARTRPPKRTDSPKDYQPQDANSVRQMVARRRRQSAVTVGRRL